MPKLVVITHGLGDAAYVLNENLTTIGRADGNTFQIAEASVSGRHCEAQLRGNELLVRELHSTNGTFINGQRISEGSEGVLRLGQILRLGQVELRLQVAVPIVAPVVPSIGASLISASAKTGPNQTLSQKPAGPSVLRSPAPRGTQGAGETGVTPTVTPVAVPPIQQTPVSRPMASSASATPASRKYQVLFVDDNTAFLETISNLFSVLANGSWEIHNATAPDQALAILQEKPIDLAVVDFSMPLLDGAQLLGLIHRRYPDVRKAVLTGEADEHHRDVCLARGADLFIEKPASTEALEAVFNMLNELVTYTAPDGFTGTLRHVGLQDVIQMKCLMRSSSILEIRNRHVSGQIYIENGAIIHAVTGTLSGEKALYKLLSLSGGEFRAHPFAAPADHTVHGGWESLLMEAARLRDETAVIVLDDSKVERESVVSS